MNDDEELDTVEESESEPSGDYAAKKRRIAMLLIAYSAIMGILICFISENNKLLEFIVGLPVLILGISWCFTDAAQRNHRIGSLGKLLLILLFIVGLPIYLFQTRGIGAIKPLAFAMVLAGVMFACSFVTACTTLYIGGIAGFW